MYDHPVHVVLPADQSGIFTSLILCDAGWALYPARPAPPSLHSSSSCAISGAGQTFWEAVAARGDGRLVMDHHSRPAPVTGAVSCTSRTTFLWARHKPGAEERW